MATGCTCHLSSHARGPRVGGGRHNIVRSDSASTGHIQVSPPPTRDLTGPAGQTTEPHDNDDTEGTFAGVSAALVSPRESEGAGFVDKRLFASSSAGADVTVRPVREQAPPLVGREVAAGDLAGGAVQGRRVC